MKALVIGGTGTIGSAVVTALRGDVEVVVAGHTSGDHQVDLASPASIEELFAAVGTVDAVLCCAGNAAFGSLDGLSDEDFAASLHHKLMGQVNVVRRGVGSLADGGSFTLTSGVLGQEPMEGSAAISLVNAGLEGFVRAAALELPRRLRINAVSPPWVSETLASMGRDPTEGLPASAVARAYRESATGTATGQVLDPRSHA